MYSIEREFVFDAAHRLLNYGGKCKYVHGHTYHAKVAVESDELDAAGFVMDFGDLKDSVGDWIKRNWDHNFIMHVNDPLVTAIQEIQDPFLLPGNPTAENMARYLFAKTEDMLGLPPGIRVAYVEVRETPACCAVFQRVREIGRMELQ